jgi:serine/threonine protein kinase
MNLVPGAVVEGRYRVEELIGRGGCGAVFRATQLNLGRAVALKTLISTGTPESLERFQREAELVQRLDHPNVVRLLDFGRTEGASPFLVFELLKGQTLAEALRREGPMPPDRVARIASQILKALMEAHGLGIVHRDLKPANVFLCHYQGAADFVKVLDFGVSKGLDSRALTQAGAMVGTPAYMAPEQVMGQPATPQSDLYALGLLMSEALSGRPVHRDKGAVEIAHEQVSEAPVPHEPMALHSPLGPMILRATQKDPGRRHASAAEMLAELDPRAAVTPASAFTAPPTTLPGLTPAYLTTQAAPLPLAGAMTPPPVVNPLVPPAPARARPKQASPPWVLLGVLGGGGALLAIVLIAVVALRSGTSSSSGSRRGSGSSGDDPRPTRSSRVADPGGHLQLKQLTVDLMIQRAEAAGYEVTNNSVHQSPGMRVTSINVKDGDRSGSALLYEVDRRETAKAMESSYRQSDDVAVVREEGYILMTKVTNGRERGNAPSQKLLDAIVR